MKKKKAKPTPRQWSDGWYEVVDTAIDAKLIRNVQETEGFRCFLRGPISGIEIIEVPADMPDAVRDALGRKLSSMGLTCLLVNENIKFYKLRRATPAEEEKLNAANKKECGAAPPPGAPRVYEAPADPVAGSVAGGDGGGGDRSDGQAAAQGDDLVPAPDGSGTDRCDP